LDRRLRGPHSRSGHIKVNIILPVVLSGNETYSPALREKQMLRVFKNTVLRRLCEQRRGDVKGG
jgi:hypothetical protein